MGLSCCAESWQRDIGEMADLVLEVLCGQIQHGVQGLLCVVYCVQATIACLSGSYHLLSRWHGTFENGP